ncbi:hypothetical protein EDEG_01269 [Edhazardia aedis USNM 41457]|uniref:Uncharacterized protein n=1 Tax=Edhazardia aedis (strain USNM 41457) TaxID=1003232 RepID=J9D9R0_EDHAE|nr:hypothetical protein EDEG_01269 [Edhazardia aedis USNM 41457]|eukprot:EJW04501.1 hypothetical protein EDEG_01269 [Edhazardia aedis USNM 41457]
MYSEHLDEVIKENQLNLYKKSTDEVDCFDKYALNSELHSENNNLDDNEKNKIFGNRRKAEKEHLMLEFKQSESPICKELALFDKIELDIWGVDDDDFIEPNKRFIW